ncbi:hypothetical protein [Spongiimicrobium salis]|uniref:hypothetical protein n=1 Tax=Spongiimicrobium salis TaxID=1667022 RepID=UPI00374CCFE3
MKSQAIKFKKAHELARDWSSYKMRKKLNNWTFSYRDFFSMALKSLNNVKEIMNDYLRIMKNEIMGDRTDRGVMFNSTGRFTKIMRVADEKSHFVGSIIENAINGKNISEKQAWCVAYFAKNNSLII